MSKRKQITKILFKMIIALPFYAIWLAIAFIPVSIYWALDYYEKDLSWWQTYREWVLED